MRHVRRLFADEPLALNTLDNCSSAFGMPDLRSPLRMLGVNLQAPPMIAEHLCRAAGGLRVHGS